MTKSLKNLVQSEAYFLVFLQLGFVIFFALLAWLLRDQMTGYALFAGGMAYVIPNFLFVWQVFRFVGAQQMTRFILAFYLGEMLKMIVSAFLVLMIVKYLPVSLLSVLSGFIVAIVSFWFICIWHFSKQKKHQGVAR